MGFAAVEGVGGTNGIDLPSNSARVVTAGTALSLTFDTDDFTVVLFSKVIIPSPGQCFYYKRNVRPPTTPILPNTRS